jgi:hypothetical protein
LTAARDGRTILQAQIGSWQNQCNDLGNTARSARKGTWSVMDKSTTLVIASVQDVEHLHSSPWLWGSVGRVELHLTGLERGEREHFETRLNELASVCGCAEGAATGGVVLIAIVFIWIQREIAFSFVSIATAAALVIGAVLLAKFMRVIVARLELRAVLGSLLRSMPGIMREQNEVMS